MKRDHWLEILSTEKERDQWIKASRVNRTDWMNGQDDASEKFQRWVRKLLNAAVKISAAEKLLLEYHEYDCPFWRIGKSHGACICKKLRSRGKIKRRGQR